MDMRMQHGLTGCYANVHANVEPVGMQFRVQPMCGVFHGSQDFGFFLVSQLEKRCDVPDRNNQTVTGRHRIVISNCRRQTALCDDPIAAYAAEWASHVRSQAKP